MWLSDNGCGVCSGSRSARITLSVVSILLRLCCLSVCTLLAAVRFMAPVSVTGASCSTAEWLTAVIHAWSVLLVTLLC